MVCSVLTLTLLWHVTKMQMTRVSKMMPQMTPMTITTMAEVEMLEVTSMDLDPVTAFESVTPVILD